MEDEVRESSLKELQNIFSDRPTTYNAIALGKAIAEDKSSLEVKKWRFAMAFGVKRTDKTAVSSLKAWYSAIMLDSNMSVMQKIKDVKSMLDNRFLPKDVLSDVVKFIYSKQQENPNLLSYLSDDFCSSDKIPDDIKSYIEKRCNDTNGNLTNYV